MAGPIYRSNGGRSQSAGATSIAPALPAVDGATGILICEVQSANNAVHSTATGGWSKLGQTNSGANFTASIFYAAEGAGAPTITWAGSVACAAQIFYFSDPQNTVDPALGANSVSSGTGTTHTSTAVNTTRDNSLMIYVDATAANTGLSTPAGWTANVNNGSGTDNGNDAMGSKSVATSGTSSGAISVTGANAAWVQWQIEIRGAAPAAGLQSSQMETMVLLGPPDGFDVSQLDVFVLIQSGTQPFHIIGT